MKRLGVVVLTGAILAHNTIFSFAQEPLSAMHAQAISLYRSKDYRHAIPLYRQLAREMPDNADVLEDLFWTLWYAEHYEEAARIGSRLVQFKPAEPSIWAALGRCYYLRKQYEQAIQAFERSLELKPDQSPLRLDKARSYLALRNYPLAMRLLRELLEKQPEMTSAEVDLAKVQGWEGLYPDSASTWARVIRALPQNPEYRFLYAQALYYSGKQPQALVMLDDNLKANPSHKPTFTFLVDAALVRNDLPKALALLENSASDPATEDARFFRLASLYQDQQNWEGCIHIMDRLLSDDFENARALLMQADCYRGQGQLEAAATRYERIQVKNPWSTRILHALADLEEARQRPQQALKWIRQARAVDPTDPALLFQESQYQYSRGKKAEANALLEKWIQANRGTRLPVLLYHGLTPIPNDPILAYSIHLPVSVFEDQMSALKAAGYTPITSEQAQAWFQGKARLPEKPLLVTFDDARIDSFRYADPVLEKLHLKATMAVPVINVAANFPGFASWAQLKAYQGSGRWDIQSHGNRGHAKIRVDAQGHEGLFMPNKLWLEKEQRLESDSEWDARVAVDLKQAQDEIARHVEVMPTMFAFPEGDFGQDNVPNFPQAAEGILKHSRALYGTLYSQDSYGINVRTRDPGLLRRLEPLARWNGRELVRRLIDRDPVVIALRTLLRRAVWEGRVFEANTWLQELKKEGASPAVLLADEARIRSVAGDRVRAQDLAMQALALNPEDPDTVQLAKSLEATDRWTWTPQAEYFEDNRERTNWALEHRLESPTWGAWKWNLIHRYGSYRETGLTEVREQGGGAGLTRALGLHHTLHLEGQGHHYETGTARDTFSALGSLRSQWTDRFETQVRGGHYPYPTARALNARITDEFAEFKMGWEKRSAWGVNLAARGETISDDNHRYTGTLDFSKALGEQSGWRLLYRATGQQTERVSPSYYSPRELQQHQAGLAYRGQWGRALNLDLRYLPGYGRERQTEWSFVQVASADLQIRLGPRLTFNPSYAMTYTPTYRSRTGQVALRVAF